ncbi:rRNA biogenesis protein rrp5 [Tissierella sp. MSJ-40]|uniref:rRNA biogenesis protein rrp5 n=1 Tax=Tissierella simiarum TaxID=2841534 RepID=A0ABS6EAD0_9FIRM|nr:rRNA biogenesis protein rrp5 [Tissierella simiarum]MBU5439893.1 rRNA biogenesis protein rrp5 [Tissierella simiarum]
MSRIKLALEVVSDLRNLADSIESLVQVIETTNYESVETEEKLPTLEEVRHHLALLSQRGKQAEVKALITKYGVRKLSEIPKEKYPELLKDAEGIQ